MNYKIAIITPTRRWDYLVNTILDGLLQLSKENKDLQFYVSSERFEYLPLQKRILSREQFTDFARSADLVFLMWGKKETDFELAREINQWHKTIFIDGSEVGEDKRFDFKLQDDILTGKFTGMGSINKEMFKLCPLYFRREKPYINGIIPFPYGIESGYQKYYNSAVKKDIDFVCIFGQDEHPIMRRYAREMLVKFCKENNFSCAVDKTDNSDEFYKLLARAKVGVSIGGGGYDTARFWEILGNNCLLMTERIDVFEPDSKELDYNRIYEFNNLFDFKYQLAKVGDFLRNGYRETDLGPEYARILAGHSAEARVLKIFGEAELKGITKR